MNDPIRWREDPSKPQVFKGLDEAPPLDEGTRESVRNQLLAATAVPATPSLAWRAPVLGATAVVLAGLLLWRFAPQTDPEPAVELERDVASAVDQAVAAAPALSALTVTSVPTNVEVWVDDQRRGVTPITLNLPPGAYELEGRKEGYENTRLPYSVLPDERSRVHLALSESREGGLQANRESRESNGIATSEAAAEEVATRAAATSEAATEVATRAVVMPPQGEGRLVVNSQPWSTVYVDGRRIGHTPVARLTVAAGQRRVRLVSSEGQEHTRIVTVRPGDTHRVIYRFDAASAVQPPRMDAQGRVGFLRVNTRPYSRVFVDGRDVGLTPLMNVRLPAGRHTLRFVYEGGEDRMRVTIEPGRTRTIVRNLESTRMSQMTATVVDPWGDPAPENPF